MWKAGFEGYKADNLWQICIKDDNFAQGKKKGTMEQWNDGLNPNIPLFHYSNIPLFSVGFLL